MRLLLVSDLHYNLPQLDWIVANADGYDLVVMAGDHLDISSTVPLDAQCVVIARYVELIRERTRVVVSSGNHDLTAPDANGEQSAPWIAALPPEVTRDGESLALDDVLVTVCKWWDGDAGKVEVDRQLAADAPRRPGTWIWVYHWPPTDSPTSWTGKKHYGDPDLVAWVAEHRPDIVLTGHVHQSPFQTEGGWADRIGDTWVFNAGRQIGGIPARVEIDLAARAADWVCMLGVESQSLDADAPAPREVV